MAKPRDGLYVWVTWLSKLMAGEVQCHWGAWFKAHYTDYKTQPINAQLANWTVEHNQYLTELINERKGLGEITYKEDQNKFRVRRPSGLVIAGKPDLITYSKTTGQYTVYDVKTGKQRQSDIIQVMLYCYCLPYASPIYKGKAQNLPINQITDKDCALFLWATVPLLPEALETLTKWGFAYKTAIFWRKIMSLGMGFWFRGQVEVCLVGIKGKVKPFRLQIPNFIQSKARTHSQKPDELYDILDKINLQPRIELFARRKVEGWDCWGNEVESNIELIPIKLK